MQHLSSWVHITKSSHSCIEGQVVLRHTFAKLLKSHGKLLLHDRCVPSLLYISDISDHQASSGIHLATTPRLPHIQGALVKLAIRLDALPSHTSAVLSSDLNSQGRCPCFPSLKQLLDCFSQRLNDELPEASCHGSEPFKK